MALSDVHWKGLKTVENMCDILPKRIAKARLGEAYKYALEPTKREMRANIKQRTGRLWHSIDSTIVGKEADAMYGIVGPRRKRGVWNMQGWHAHLIEKGTDPHDINAGAKNSMPLYQAKRFLGFVKRIKHKGYEGKKPFKTAIDATWQDVGARVSMKVSEIMSNEIAEINRQNSDL